MSSLKALFVLLVVAFPLCLYAGVLRGKITDDKGQPLPYATIYLQGTTIGTNATANGNYELTVAPGLYKLICQHIGYSQSSFNISVSGGETVEHDFVLKDQSLELNELVVHATSEDPAYAIIRNAIAKRKAHLEQVRSFETSIYLKGVMRSHKFGGKMLGRTIRGLDVDSAGNGVLYLTEEYADYYSQGRKNKTIIHSVRESGAPNGVGFSEFPSVISFYNNNVNVFDDESRGYISPIGDNALYYYKYKLQGQFEEQGRVIYKIQVKQKRNYEPCFNGTIYIADSDWAIHSLDMTLTKQSGMDMIDTLQVEQLFLPVGPDNWVIKSQVLSFAIGILGSQFTGVGVTSYSNQKENGAIPDSVFGDKFTSIYDNDANRKDSSYWRTTRPIPLEKDEQRDFLVKDSIRKVLQDPAYRDSIRLRKNRPKPFALLLSGQTFYGKDYRNSWSINSLLLGLSTDNILNYNIVEGFNIAPKLNWKHNIDSNKYLQTDVAARYGFSDTHFNTIGRVYYVTRDKAFPNRWWLMGGEGGKYVFQYDPDNPILPWFNTYSALFARDNDLKLYERKDASVFLRHNTGKGLTWFIKASYQQRIPLQNTTDYSFMNETKGNFHPNVPANLYNEATAWEKHDATIATAIVTYKPFYTYTQYPGRIVANGSSWPLFSLRYDKGIPGILNSISDFDKWRFMMQNDIKLKLFGTLKYNIGAGGFLNTTYVSIPDLMHLYGNRGIGYASPYLQSFQFAQYYEFSNKEPLYGEAHLEHHFNGLLSNKIPLLKQARWYLLLGGNAFYARQSDYYTEAFIGIDNIGWKFVRPLRLDFVQSWDSHGGHNSGFRFGLDLQGLTTPKQNLTNSEW